MQSGTLDIWRLKIQTHWFAHYFFQVQIWCITMKCKLTLDNSFRDLGCYKCSLQQLASSRDKKRAVQVWQAHFFLTPHPEFLFFSFSYFQPVDITDTASSDMTWGSLSDFTQLPIVLKKTLLRFSHAQQNSCLQAFLISDGIKYFPTCLNGKIKLAILSIF